MSYPKSSDNSLFHYTDIAAVASIIKNNKLWLTNIGFLNDSQEYHDGMSVVSRRVGSMVIEADTKPEAKEVGLSFVQGVLEAYNQFPSSSNIFTCSFSRAKNLLSQWRAYGNFSIEFSRQALEQKHVLHECVYSTGEKEELSEVMISQLIDAAGVYLDSRTNEPLPALSDFTARISTFKNHYFEAEHEVRILGKSNYEKSNVLHRARGNYLVPYIEIDFPVGSILAVHVGPIADQELAVKSLRSFLISCGLRDLPIITSDIPYRS